MNKQAKRARREPKATSPLVKVERQEPTSDGKWFAARSLPYGTLDNKIDGVVITFTDITTPKKVEAELRGKGGTQ